MAEISRKGFGQVEPNHLSGIVEGKIYAQLPVDKDVMGNIIENGRFAKYNYQPVAATQSTPAYDRGKVDLSADGGQWLMIYNEQKLYDERYQGLKDFAMIANDFVDGEITPRLIYIEIGDIFTTNTFGANTSNTATVSGPTLVEGNKVYVNGTTGYLTAVAADKASDSPEFKVVKVYTMPDGQPGVKLQRIK